MPQPTFSVRFTGLEVRFTLSAMKLEMREYSAAKIGQLWTSGDHQFLVAALDRIDQICVDVWN